MSRADRRLMIAAILLHRRDAMVLPTASVRAATDRDVRRPRPNGADRIPAATSCTT